MALFLVHTQHAEWASNLLLIQQWSICRLPQTSSCVTVKNKGSHWKDVWPDTNRPHQWTKLAKGNNKTWSDTVIQNKVTTLRSKAVRRRRRVKCNKCSQRVQQAKASRQWLQSLEPTPYTLGGAVDNQCEITNQYHKYNHLHPLTFRNTDLFIITITSARTFNNSISHLLTCWFNSTQPIRQLIQSIQNTTNAQNIRSSTGPILAAVRYEQNKQNLVYKRHKLDLLQDQRLDSFWIM
jgi:hypothetical protein